MLDARDRFTYGIGPQSEGSFVQTVSTTPDFDTALEEFQTQRAATLAKFPPAVDPASLNNLSGPSLLSGALFSSTAPTSTPSASSSAQAVPAATISLSIGTPQGTTVTASALAPQNTTAGSNAQEPSGAMGRAVWGGKLLWTVALLSSIHLLL